MVLFSWQDCIRCPYSSANGLSKSNRERATYSPGLSLYGEEHIQEVWGPLGQTAFTDGSCPGFPEAESVYSQEYHLDNCHSLAENHFQSFIGFVIIFIQGVDERILLYIQQSTTVLIFPPGLCCMQLFTLRLSIPPNCTAATHAATPSESSVCNHTPTKASFKQPSNWRSQKEAWFLF